MGKRGSKKLDLLVKIFGKNVADLRAERRWSQEFLGEKIGISAAQVSKIENGKAGFSIKVLEKLKSVFGVDYVEFFKSDDGDQLPPIRAALKTLEKHWPELKIIIRNNNKNKK